MMEYVPEIVIDNASPNHKKIAEMVLSEFTKYQGSIRLDSILYHGKQLGSGAFSVAVDIGQDRVMKSNFHSSESHVDSDGAVFWLDWCAENQTNPFVPKLFFYARYDRYFIAIMEKLELAKDISYKQQFHNISMYIHSLCKWNDREDRYCKLEYSVRTQDAKDTLNKLARSLIVLDNKKKTSNSKKLRDLKKAAKAVAKISLDLELSLDLHDHNFMIDSKGMCVITDPYCD